MATKKKTVKKVAKKSAPKRVPKQRSMVIQSPVDPKLAIAVASEFADDALIEAEMLGQVLDTFVYRFEQEGKEVVGLTVKGVNEVVRRLGKDPKSGSKIRISPEFVKKEEVERDGEKGIEVSVYAEDLISGNSAWGIKFEPYKKTGRKGEYKNAFAVEKALSKAERNAKRKLISESLATKMIDKLIKENPNNVKTLEAPKHIDVTVHPVITQPSSPEELEALIRKALSQAKTLSQVVDIDEKTQASQNLSPAFKEEIHKLAMQMGNKFA